MRVAALELPARFDRVTENLALADALLARGACDLALLPEASLTGYVSRDGNFDLAPFGEPRDGVTSRALAALAKKHATHLVGPLVERDGERTYNAMIGFDPDGREWLHYRKRHPWYPETWATPGDAPAPVVRIGDVRITIATCFDVHFLARDLAAADVLLFPSAWVEDEDGHDSRLALLGALGLHVVNANWGFGEPRLSGQGNSCILHASRGLLARGGPRIDATLEPVRAQ